MRALRLGVSAPALAFATATEGSAGSGPLSLEEAIGQLDPTNDDHWTAAGLPSLAILKTLTGNTSLTRDEVDAIGRVRDSAGTTEGETEPAPSEPPELGAHVLAYAPPRQEGKGAHDGGFDGDDTAVAIVVKTYEDGSVNLKVLAPNGGADIFVTGAKQRTDGSETVATWDWLPDGDE